MDYRAGLLAATAIITLLSGLLLSAVLADRKSTMVCSPLPAG